MMFWFEFKGNAGRLRVCWNPAVFSSSSTPSRLGGKFNLSFPGFYPGLFRVQAFQA